MINIHSQIQGEGENSPPLTIKNGPKLLNSSNQVKSTIMSLNQILSGTKTLLRVVDILMRRQNASPYNEVEIGLIAVEAPRPSLSIDLSTDGKSPIIVEKNYVSFGTNFTAWETPSGLSKHQSLYFDRGRVR